MKKFSIAVLAVFLLGTMPAANAEIVTPTVDSFGESKIVSCGYKLFAKRKEELLQKLNRNSKDAATWNELGRICNALEDYAGAVDAFGKAVKLEPNNKEYRKNLDDARENLRKQESLKNIKPKFNGLG